MLFTEVLDAAELGLLGAGLDPAAVAASLRQAKVSETQREADFLASVSSKAEWASESVPAVLATPGTYWLEWRIPRGAHCGGEPLGALVTVERTEAGTRLTTLCFMRRTAMLRFEIEFDAKGSVIPAGRLLTDVVHDGRQRLSISSPSDPTSPERDDLYCETFSWVFVVPVLFHFIAAALGGLEQALTVLQRVGGLHAGRALPDALTACRNCLSTPRVDMRRISHRPASEQPLTAGLESAQLGQRVGEIVAKSLGQRSPA